MLRIEASGEQLVPLGRRELRSASFFERYDLRTVLAAGPEALFTDAGLPLRAIGSGFTPMGAVAGQTTAAMSALDPSGRVWVVGYQQGKQKPDLTAALERASLVSTWSPSEVLQRADWTDRIALEQFLRVPFERLNRGQGVVLVAEEFDEETQSMVLWLRQTYRLHVLCVELRMKVETPGDAELLVARTLSFPGTGTTAEAEDPEPSWTTPPVPAARKAAAPRLHPAAQPTAPIRPPVEPATVATLARAPQAPPIPAPFVAPAAEPEPTPQPVAPEPAVAAPAGPAEVEEPLSAEPIQAPPSPAEPIEPTKAARAGSDDVVEALLPSDLIDSLEGPPDDPLTSLLEEVEKARERLESGVDDRRRETRSAEYHARRLRLDHLGRLLGARVVDFSRAGLGVEALSPLPVGTEIGISGEVVGVDGGFSIEGRVRVTHCRARPDGVCRIGFDLDHAVLSEMDKDAEDFDRR